MNPNRKKKLFATVLAGVLSFSTMIGTFDRVGISAAEEKPFISDTDGNGRINIDESQIQVDITQGSGVNGTSLDAVVDVKRVKSNGTIQVPLLSRINLTMEISADGLTEEMISNMYLNVTATNNDSDLADSTTNTYSKKTYSYTEPTEFEPFGTYTVTFHFTAYGTDLAFYTNSLSDVADLQFHGGAVVTSLSGFYMINVDTPLEDVMMRVPIRSGISNEEYITWATRVAVYINSICELTNFRHNRYLIVMNDEAIDSFGLYRYHGIISYNQKGSDEILAYITNSENKLSWAEMHEIGHAHGYETNFKEWYHYFNSGYGADEMQTNVRGITAIQNCDNLQDTELVISNIALPYDRIMTEFLEIKNGDALVPMAAYIVNVAYENGWEFLEEFFKYETAYLPEDYPAVIDEFKAYSERAFKADATAYQKYAMAMYALYDLAKKNNNISAEDSFSEYLDRYFYNPATGDNCVKLYVDRLLREDLYPIQICKSVSLFFPITQFRRYQTIPIPQPHSVRGAAFLYIQSPPQLN